MTVEDDKAHCVSATGIEQCLQMLAQEAISIGMLRTAFALQEAVELCRDEAIAYRLRSEDGTDATQPQHGLLN